MNNYRVTIPRNVRKCSWNLYRFANILSAIPMPHRVRFFYSLPSCPCLHRRRSTTTCRDSMCSKTWTGASLMRTRYGGCACVSHKSTRKQAICRKWYTSPNVQGIGSCRLRDKASSSCTRTCFWWPTASQLPSKSAYSWPTFRSDRTWSYNQKATAKCCTNYS